MRGVGTDQGKRSANPVTRYVIVLVAGLLLSSVHWVGLLLGGMLLGLLAPTTPRGVAYGAAFGLLVWVLFVGRMAALGVTPTMETGQLFGVSFAIPVILGAVGGSARELRPWFDAVGSRLDTDKTR